MDKITLSPICTDCKYCMQSWNFFDYALREEYASCAFVFPHQQSNGKPGFASLFLRYRCKGRLFVKQENGPTRRWRYLNAGGAAGVLLPDYIRRDCSVVR